MPPPRCITPLTSSDRSAVLWLEVGLGCPLVVTHCCHNPRGPQGLWQHPTPITCGLLPDCSRLAPALKTPTWSTELRRGAETLGPRVSSAFCWLLGPDPAQAPGQEGHQRSEPQQVPPGAASPCWGQGHGGPATAEGSTMGLRAE